jgi:uncharacterized membrane protein
LVSYLRVRNLLAWSYDLGFYVQDLFAIRAGLWKNTILGFGIFSDHVSPILIPLAWLVPSAAPGEVLVILQAVALGAGVFPISRLGFERAGRQGAALACTWYAASAAIWHALMYDFHPVTLALPFGAWVLLEVQREARGRPWLPLLAMPLIREDVALLYGVVVLVAGIRYKQRPWRFAGLAVALLGMVYMLAMSVQPGIQSHIWYRYRFESLGELLARPLRVDVIVGITAVLLPLLVLPVLKGWKEAWPGLLLLGSYAMSSWTNQASLYYQYYAQAVPFLIAGGLYGFSSSGWTRRLRMSILGTLLCGAVLGPLFYIGFGLPDRYASVVLSSGARAQARALIYRIPEDASVSATEMLGPAVAWRPQIHPFPGPMVCGNSLGYFVESTAGVDYVLFEADSAPEGQEWPAVLKDWGYVQLDRIGEVELWKSAVDDVPTVRCPNWEEQKELASVG